MIRAELESSFKEQMESLFAQVKRQTSEDVSYEKMWEHFSLLGLPSKQTEAYRYLKLRHLFSQKIELASFSTVSKEEIVSWIAPECSQSVLVFVNGIFDATLSCTEALPSKIVISTLLEASEAYDTLLSNLWSKTVKEEKDPFAALNGAFYGSGGFLYIPPKCEIGVPVQILQIAVGNSAAVPMISPRFLIVVGQQSKAQFLFSYQQINSHPCMINAVAELIINEESHIHVTQQMVGDDSHGWHFDALRATLKRNSSLKTVAVTNGRTSLRLDYKVALAGEGAEALLNGVSMLSTQNESHVHVLMDHQAPHCRSYQLFKNVLHDFSRSSFEGKILVRQVAQKTEAFQLNKNLLLDNHCQADSKPNLEIFADDVKASHGATIGQLDGEQIFYMKTRGFSEAMAREMLVNGFCEEIIEMIPHASVREVLSNNKRSTVYA